jgi:hypothetical protein
VKPVYVGHLWFHLPCQPKQLANLQKIVFKFPIFVYVVTAYLTIVLCYFCHLDKILKAPRSVSEITGSEVNSKGIFLLTKFSDQTKVTNIASLC